MLTNRRAPCAALTLVVIAAVVMAVLIVWLLRATAPANAAASPDGDTSGPVCPTLIEPIVHGVPDPVVATITATGADAQVLMDAMAAMDGSRPIAATAVVLSFHLHGAVAVTAFYAGQPCRVALLSAARLKAIIETIKPPKPSP